MSSDELRDCKNISRKEVFCGRNLKKKTQNILCVTWYLCRGKKEGKKEAAYLKRMWQRLLGCSSFWTFTRFWDNFWEYGSSQTIFTSDVSKESGYMVKSAPTICWTWRSLFFIISIFITVVIIVVTSLSDIWKERMCCCDDDYADDADDDKHQAYQIFQNLKREAWF